MTKDYDSVTLWRQKPNGVAHRCSGKWRRGRTIHRALTSYSGVPRPLVVPRYACFKCLSYFEITVA